MPLLAAQAASPFNLEIETENIILVALRVFEFSHSLGQTQTSGRIRAKSVLPPTTDMRRLRQHFGLVPEADMCFYSEIQKIGGVDLFV